MVTFNLIIKKTESFVLRDNFLFLNNNRFLNNNFLHRVRIVTEIIYDPTSGPIEAFIDTGALHSVIPLYILEGDWVQARDIDLTNLPDDIKETFLKIGGLGGVERICDFKWVSCWLRDKNEYLNFFEFPAKIIRNESTVVLGMMGFLEKYKLYIDVTGENAFLVIP